MARRKHEGGLNHSSILDSILRGSKVVEWKDQTQKNINQILKEKWLDGFNSVSVAYVINVDSTACKDHEPTVDTKQYMSDIGLLLFVTDMTHLGIGHIVGVLGRNLHIPTKRHLDSLKPIYRYLSTRMGDGLVNDKNGPLEFTCHTDGDYDGCMDTRKSVSGSLLMPNGILLMKKSTMQTAPTN